MKQERTIRIFISSTFRDMHSERDYLVRYVFPELKERCLKKGLHLVDVDLRWGVTEEQAESGKVLEICLDEIENCRPFFIGILGERYGWVPDTYDVPDMARYDWLKEFEDGHSVTALEIYHGVLKNHAMKPRAFFYFRDPAFISKVPENKRPDANAENPDASGRLSKLKDDIREAFSNDSLYGHIEESYPCTYRGLRVNWLEAKAELGDGLSEQDMALLREIVGEDNLLDNDEHARLNEKQCKVINRYSDVYLEGLETFGEAVLEDLWQAIEDEYPESEAETDPLVIEDTHHLRFMEQRSRIFIGREDTLGSIADYLNDAGRHMPFVLAGEAGSGKSAVMAVAARTWRKNHPDDCLVTRFVGASPMSHEVDRLLLNIIETVSRRFDIPFDATELVNMDKISEAFRLTLNTAARQGRVVIFIDALNQMMPTFHAHTLNWLPKRLPENVRMVVSTLPGQTVDAAVRAGIPVTWMQSLPSDNSRALVKDRLEVFRKGLGHDRKRGRDQMELLLGKADADKPLYLTVACEELRVYPRFEEITDRIDQMPGTIPGLFAQVLARLEEDHGRQLVRDAFSLIASSRYGLLESELLELLKREGEDRLPSNIWARLGRAAAAYLHNAGENREGLIGFFHQQLLDAVKDRYLKDEQARKSYYQMLAGYGLTKFNSKSGDITNTILFTGIYLYQIGDGKCLYKFLQDIFSLTDPLFAVYKVIAGTLFEWVAYSKPYTDESLLKQILLKLVKKIFSLKLSTFFFLKGTLFEKTGNTLWSLFFFTTIMDSLKKLQAKEPERLDLRRELAVCIGSIGKIYQTIGDSNKALLYYEEDLQIMEELCNKEPDRTDFRRDLSASFSNVARIYQAMGDSSKALLYFKKELQTIEMLCAKEPDDTDFIRDITVNFNNIGYIFQSIGDGDKAILYFEKSLKLRRELCLNKPDRIEFSRDLFISLSNIGYYFYNIRSDSSKALPYFEESFRIIEDLCNKDPNRTDFSYYHAVTYNNLGKIFETMNDNDKAILYFEKSLQIMDELCGKEPDRTDFYYYYGVSIDYLGNIYKSLGNNDKAILYFNQYFLMMERLCTKEPDRTDFRRDLSVSLNNLGKSYESTGGTNKAISYFEKSIQIMEELCTKEPDRVDFRVDYAISHWNMYRVCRKEEEIAWLTKAKSVLAPLVQNGITHGQLGQLWGLVNDALEKQG